MTNLVVFKRPINQVPREELLLRDVTQMFWELRELREEVKNLRRENTDLIRKNKKLQYENDLFFLSSMRE